MAKSLEQLEQTINSLQSEIAQFKREYAIHQHVITDGTAPLRKNITLDQDQVYTAGSAQWGSEQFQATTSGRQYYSVIATGPQMQRTTTNQFPNYQLVIRHFPDLTARLSTLHAQSNPIVISFANTSITTTSGGTTVTITGYNFPTDSLINAWINIYNSSGVMQEAWKILSNTATVITIDGNWLHTTTGGFFEIYSSSYLGDFMHIWAQLYLQKGGDDGGIRFGPGLFSGGQQAALYVDETSGDLIYVPDNVALEQNISAAVLALAGGTTGDFWASSDQVNLDLHVFVNDGIVTAII